MSSDVDEVGGFGKKGWGKSWSVNHSILPYISEADFSSVVFRRTSRDFADLWEKAKLHYAGYKIRANEQTHTITFPSGARRRFSHLQYAKDVFAHNGQEYQDIQFDELAQFPMMPYQFMFSCLRGVNPSVPKRVRATGNFYGEGLYWVKARFYDVLRPTTVVNGQLIKGEIGWFKTLNGKDVRAPKETESELFALCQHKDWRQRKSEIPHLRDWMSREWYFGERSDNVDLTRNDPDYESRLEQLPEQMKRAFKYGLPQEESNPNQLFLSEWVDAALTGKNVVDTSGPSCFGLDYAETGDNTVMVEGRGAQVYSVTDYPYTPHPAMAEVLRQWIRDNGVHYCKGGVDTVGTGAGVYTSLQGLDSTAAGRVNTVRHHDTSLSKEYEQNATSVLFKHLQYQILWKLRIDLQFGRIDLSPLNTSEHYYEGVAELREELLSFRIQERDSGIWISSSDDLRRAQWADGSPCLGRSPDRVKALAIWNYVRDWKPSVLPVEKGRVTHNDYDFEDESKPKKPRSAFV